MYGVPGGRPGRKVLLREAGVYQVDQGVYRLLLVGAVGDDPDGNASHDAQAEHTQQALALTRRSSFSTQMEDLNSLAFWMKNVAGRAWSPT